MAAAAVDVGYLSASYAVPESTLQSLLSEPTVELVQSLLVQIEARAREYDELQSEKLRSDVELENAVRSGDTRAKALKASADKALKEVEELRQKLSQEGKYSLRKGNSAYCINIYLPQKMRATRSRRSCRTSNRPRRARHPKSRPSNPVSRHWKRRTGTHLPSMRPNPPPTTASPMTSLCSTRSLSPFVSSCLS